MRQLVTFSGLNNDVDTTGTGSMRLQLQPSQHNALGVKLLHKRSFCRLIIDSLCANTVDKKSASENLYLVSLYDLHFLASTMLSG
jgi:hypothetical protein